MSLSGRDAPAHDIERDTMSTGLHFLDVGLVIALLVGIFWWMYSLSFRSRAERKQQRNAEADARQPWEADKAGGRGNR